MFKISDTGMNTSTQACWPLVNWSSRTTQAVDYYSRKFTWQWRHV